MTQCETVSFDAQNVTRQNRALTGVVLRGPDLWFGVLFGPHFVRTSSHSSDTHICLLGGGLLAPKCSWSFAKQPGT